MAGIVAFRAGIVAFAGGFIEAGIALLCGPSACVLVADAVGYVIVTALMVSAVAVVVFAINAVWDEGKAARRRR